jgi:hypothetical protein
VLSAGSIVRGRTANAEIAERGMAEIEKMEVLEYQVDFEEILAMGDDAYEWGKRTSRPLQSAGRFPTSRAPRFSRPGISTIGD